MIGADKLATHNEQAIADQIIGHLQPNLPGRGALGAAEHAHVKGQLRNGIVEHFRGIGNRQVGRRVTGPQASRGD